MNPMHASAYRLRSVIPIETAIRILPSPDPARRTACSPVSRPQESGEDQRIRVEVRVLIVGITSESAQRAVPRA